MLKNRKSGIPKGEPCPLWLIRSQGAGIAKSSAGGNPGLIKLKGSAQSRVSSVGAPEIEPCAQVSIICKREHLLKKIVNSGFSKGHNSRAISTGPFIPAILFRIVHPIIFQILFPGISMSQVVTTQISNKKACPGVIAGYAFFERWERRFLTLRGGAPKRIRTAVLINFIRVNQTRNIYFLQIIIHPAISAGCTQPGIPALLAAWPVSGLGVSVCFSTISWPGH